jgi:hypothetical protein
MGDRQPDDADTRSRKRQFHAESWQARGWSGVIEQLRPHRNFCRLLDELMVQRAGCRSASGHLCHYSGRDRDPGSAKVFDDDDADRPCARAVAVRAIFWDRDLQDMI